VSLFFIIADYDYITGSDFNIFVSQFQLDLQKAKRRKKWKGLFLYLLRRVVVF